jgi:hypothetical protein
MLVLWRGVIMINKKRELQRNRIAKRIKEIRGLINVSSSKKLEAIYPLIRLGHNYPKNTKLILN